MNRTCGRKIAGSGLALILSILVFHSEIVASFVTTGGSFASTSPSRTKHHLAAVVTESTADSVEATANVSELFDEFASFLQTKQSQIINQIEELEREFAEEDSEAQGFSKDCWGIFENVDNITPSVTGSGGITCVIQKGKIIEKGACSFTLLKNGKLTAERAASVRGRQEGRGENDVDIKEGDVYCAAALSMVLHTRSPMVPTFRSDVRIFMVESSTSSSDDSKKTVAWFGGGSDLTPYYLFDDDIRFFHRQLKDLCEKHQASDDMIDYPKMKQACDEYFYLPARSEHRGVGGMFFDDLPANLRTMDFVQDVTSQWMPSWFPIIENRQNLSYTEQQREWQLLRRGRYLEFNLLYDRGVKFGLANANPRVEGVMVSAPPLIAWEYNHQIEPNSEEERLMKILKSPVDWA